VSTRPPRLRLLDRPLWGQRELWVYGYTPHQPDPAVWSQLPYPPPPLAPPELRIDVVRQIVDGARARGLAVEIQISPYTLPGSPGGQTFGGGHGTGALSDRPVRIDGSVGERIVVGHGCPNNPRVRALGRARMQDALAHYADVDGVFVDWAEYTSYFLEDCFVCFCEHCQVEATRQGYAWSSIVRDTRALWDRLHQLTPTDLARATDGADWPFLIADGLVALPGVAEWLRFKSASVRAAAADLRQAMDAAGASGVALGLNGFAPPWSRITGMDYRSVHAVAQATRCKLFTFHWPMIVRWWSETLLQWNPDLDEIAVLQAVQAVLDLPPPAAEHRRFPPEDDMPRPDEPHPIIPEALTRKVNQAVRLAEAGGAAGRCLAYVHSYRPPGEFRRVLKAILASDAPGCWVQRYGYLSDEKLAIMQEVWRR
jgi:hypothetical protein